MKVLIATPYFSPKVGGLEVYAEHIARGLARAGWEVHVVTSGTSNSRTRQGSITIHTLKTWLHVANTPVSPAWIWQARRIIRELQPDVINVHAPVPSMALAVAMSAGKTPVVATYHAGSMKKGHVLVDLLIAGYEKFLLPLLMQRAASVICASDFVREQFLQAWTAKSTTITPGVDSRRFTPAPHKRVSGRVLFVGDFRDPRKGLTYLLEAVSAVPQATLRVVGQGSGPTLRGVEYTGILTGRELIREIQSANVLVLPSTTDAESFGMVLLEAMACGVPVVGSNIGGVGYVISHNVTGLLVPAADSRSLAASIHSLLTNRQQADALGRQGRQEAVEKYSWAARVHDTSRVLGKAAGLETNHV